MFGWGGEQAPSATPAGSGAPTASPVEQEPEAVVPRYLGGPGNSDAEGSGAGLFDRYASPSSAGRVRRGHSPTRTSRLRTQGVKLACYLNTECDRGRSTIIHLPEECDTLGEVLPKIQQAMQLDSRMLYAAECFLPSGEKITSYQQLIQAAAIDTAIIVGCGEPFDPSTIPFDILEFHLQGGGREAPKKVKKELAEKRKAFAVERADTIRASGHGVFPNSSAVVTARSRTVETNRELAAHMRHEYMEQLMYRASQQQELVSRVRECNQMHQIEHKESKNRRMRYEASRLQKIDDEKKAAKEEYRAKKASQKQRIKAIHDKVKTDYDQQHGKIADKRSLLRATRPVMTSSLGHALKEVTL